MRSRSRSEEQEILIYYQQFKTCLKLSLLACMINSIIFRGPMKALSAKATIYVGESKVVIEGSEEFVQQQLQKLQPTPQSSNPPSKKEIDLNVSGKITDSALRERDLIQQKAPANHIETVAVLAFGLAATGQVEFNEEDIKKAYLRAGVKPPKVVAQSLRDAKNKFDLIDAGSKRGTYRLSHHGDRTVRFDLPRK